jgi:protein SCO1/2
MAEINPTLQPAQKPPPADPSLTHLRRLLWLLGGLAMVAAFALLGGWWLRPPELHGVLLQSPRQAQDFTLAGPDGTPVALSDFRGKFVLLYFGYTSCPDVCPTTLNDLATMARTLGEERMQKVQVVFISVDPARDTPERIAIFMRAFDSRFVGLTGTLAEIETIASQFGIFFARSAGGTDENYTVDHTSVVTVVDPGGYVRLVFPYDTSADDMAADMAYLLRRG